MENCGCCNVSGVVPVGGSSSSAGLRRRTPAMRVSPWSRAHRSLRPGQPHGGSIVPEQIPVRLGALGRNTAKAAERDLIQVSDHGNQPPDKNSSRKPAVAVSESLYRKKKGMANGFPLCSEKLSKRPKNGDSCHTPYLRFRRKTPCPEGETPVGHFAGFGEGVTRRQQQPGQI